MQPVCSYQAVHSRSDAKFAMEYVHYSSVTDTIATRSGTFAVICVVYLLASYGQAACAPVQP